ncbi:MAG: acyl-CoA dehydrogenase family protein, partial [bacterium]|nr:acyl-CoA dehydrogenase family protein [bacterium]
MPYQALDYYRIEDLFTDEERMIRDTVRDFVTERLMPIIQSCNRGMRRVRRSFRLQQVAHSIR